MEHKIATSYYRNALTSINTEMKTNRMDLNTAYLHSPWCRVLLEKLNWFAASQEIPRISRNLKVHYCTHKCLPPVCILGHPNPVHIPTSHLLEIHPNIIHPSTPRSPQWSPSLRFTHQDPIHPPSPDPYVPHAQPISFFSILSPAQCWVRSTDHLAPHYAISSIPPLPRPFLTLSRQMTYIYMSCIEPFKWPNGH